MSKGVTRHLKYVWIEYGHPADAAALTDGLFGMGWGNLVSALPIAKDAWGQRYVDSSHDLLPIRYRGGALLVLPNERRDKKPDYPYIDDPIFKKYRTAHGDATFDAEIAKQNEFIAKWVFSPGLKKVSDTEGHLTLGADFTDYADFSAISGHGAAGTCWGGGANANLQKALRVPPDPGTNRLKYVMIATCFNLMEFNADSWLPAMRRSNPIHGFLGYESGYPGDEPGAVFFRKFIDNLKAKASPKSAPGTKTILDAWKEAHTGYYKDIWAALLHTSSKTDTMADWMAGKLPTPSAGGEIRWFNHSNYPTGTVMLDSTPDVTVFFFMGATKISRANNDRKDVGLFPGESGALEIANTAGFFSIGDVVTVMFYYFRPNKDGMDLAKLLTFGTSPDGDVTLKRDLNKEDGSTNIDALEFKLTKATRTAKIPFTVHADSLKAFKREGETHGYFNLRITPPGSTVGGSSDLRPYPDGAWLRPKKP